MALCVTALPARAQSFSANDLIAAVNNLRASRGLAPYQIDGGLMSYAQEHSQYQASINTSTHNHSDGNGPSAYGVTENVAGGDVGYLTLDAVINSIWADPVHMKTMVGYDSGYVGAGIAVGGNTVYVTLDVRPGESAAPQPGAPSGAAPPAGTQIALVPLLTATPRSDGAVVHEVGYGQSLWSIAIAYGTKIDFIRGLNGLIPGSTDIYAGQRLLIFQAGSLTPPAGGSTTLQGTPAAPEENRTQQATKPATATISPAASDTPSPTFTPSLEPTRAPVDLSKVASTRALAILLIVVGVAGVVWVLVSSFHK
jgi:hypothetical protein